MENKRDTAALLHLVSRGMQWSDTSKYAVSEWGWEQKRAKAAESSLTQYVKVFSSRIKTAGEELLAEHPAEHFAELSGVDDLNTTPLADLDTRRRILQSLKVTGAKYEQPFNQGTFAAASLMGTIDWQAYANLVVQMVQADTLLNIEDKLGRLVDALEEEQDPARASSTGVEDNST